MRSAKCIRRGRTAGALRQAARFAVAAAVAICCVVPALGQTLLPKGLAGVVCGGLFPTGDFNEHVSQEGIGLALYYARRIRSSPLFVGLEGTYSDYGHVGRVEYLQGIPDVGVDVDTYNSIAQGLAFLRLQPRSGRIVTYVEALAGFSYLFTETTIGEDDSDSDSLASETNFEDWTWSAGAGAGLGIRLDKNRAWTSGSWLFEIKVRYLAGGQANYLKKGSIILDGNGYTFTPERSATSFVTLQAGFTFLF